METSIKMVSKAGHPRHSLLLMATLNAVSLLAAAGLVLVLNPEDKVTKKRGGVITALGFVYFMSLSELLNGVALATAWGARLRLSQKLSVADVLEINNKLVSAVQAILSVITGVVVCSYSCSRDFARTSHYMSEAYAWFGAAYFFYDIYSMYMVHIQMQTEKAKQQQAKDGAPSPAPVNTSFWAYCRHEPVILMHHIFIGAFGFLVITYFRGPFGDCTFGFVYLMELSTPFVSARGVLSRLRRKAGRLYVANGLAMLAAFFVCRVASLPYVCLIYSRYLGVSYIEAIKSLPTGCKISISILLLPQLYWFYLMCAGAVKVFLCAAPQKAAGDAPAPRASPAPPASPPHDKRS